MRTRRLTALLVMGVLGGCDDDKGPAAPPAAAMVTPDAGAAMKATTPDAGPAAAGPDAQPMAVLSSAELAVVKTLSPLPALPKNPTNKFADNAQAATLGQMLFFETSYSGALAVGDDGMNGAAGKMGDAGKLSCASCHVGPGLDDRRSKPNTVSLGADWLTRNSLGLVNSSYYKWTNWAGRFSAQWELPIAVAENARNMNSNRLKVVHTLASKYKAEYQAAFGVALDPALGTDADRFPANGRPKANAMADDGAWEKMAAADRDIVNAAFANYGKALEAYMRTLISTKSRFDEFVAGKTSALSSSEQKGLQVFLGKGSCVTCHKGPNFTDDRFYNLGVPRTGERVPMSDNGRFADIPGLLGSPFNTAGAYSDDKTTGRLEGLTAMPTDSTRGQFRTSSLRNINNTAPYMHAGQLATLADVVDFYDKGGGEPQPMSTKDAAMKPLNLSTQEKADLVAFLKTLDMDAVPAATMVDTAKK